MPQFDKLNFFLDNNFSFDFYKKYIIDYNDIFVFDEIMILDLS